MVRWRGVAMGAEASLLLVHHDKKVATRTLQACVDEIARLEMALSLYEPKSELSRLNRDGTLPSPSLDFLRCMSAAQSISDLSLGAFDVSVQPLFEFYRVRGDSDLEEGRINEVLALVNYRDIEISAREIRFRKPGMAATLNGIAQGYVCDRVADLLRQAGFGDAMVNLGEIAALGNAPDGRPWSVGVAGPEKGGAGPVPTTSVGLRNRAMATSSPRGYFFDASGSRHHLFDPRNGQSSNRYRSVTVMAPSATVADALSTAVAAMSYREIKNILAETAALEVNITLANGQRHRFHSVI